MALARLNLPGVLLYSGSIARACCTARTSPSRTSSKASVRSGRQHHRSGTGSDRRCRLPGRGRLRRAVHGQHDGDRHGVPRHRADGQRHGRAPPIPARTTSAIRTGELVMDVLKRGLKPRDIMTREAFENGIRCAASTGGSTNVVLHLLAHRPRSRRPTQHRRLRHDQHRHAAHRRSAARRTLCRARHGPRGRHQAPCEAAARSRQAQRRRRHRHRPHHRGRGRAPRRRRRARMSSSRSNAP